VAAGPASSPGPGTRIEEADSRLLDVAPQVGLSPVGGRHWRGRDRGWITRWAPYAGPSRLPSSKVTIS